MLRDVFADTWGSINVLSASPILLVIGATTPAQVSAAAP
jgi:hypothetical protein